MANGIMMKLKKDASAKWGVSDRRVLQYCNADRIKGAVKMGNTWLIPKNAEKPADERFKNSRTKTAERKGAIIDE